MDVQLGQLSITSLKIFKKFYSTSDNKLSLQFQQQSFGYGMASLCAYHWLPPRGGPLDRL